ncbi:MULTISPECIES: FemAB family XrtA/PEP-CTERM system-associated protein [unclassified Novosphingobium]|uniref:FemAB family XrtA/PEP-CTERM system-associated protein n=1 Tax=unclassified Novosphingobium TaxID=2644732 RepID=UPI00146CD509|nr:MULTISPECIES: FemAB family XrtA/PEP-CTERM system-associated protein [unclassified Novosphingobium]NMN03668.1 FemAB-related protein (PEP-CTERM system-associated) [Novosphingobium sp. SG919]NMN86342.1 FemAB-related protein (PEP-CTERM system-associated) [Novosphingobium sp. SG916]
MNAPFRLGAPTVREAGPDDRAAYDRFLAGHDDASVFHDPRWLDAVAQGSGHASRLLLAEQAGVIVAALPLHAVSSVLFGRALVSTGFAVGGGIVGDAAAAPALVAAAQDLAQRLKSPTIELRGGVLPQAPGWHVKQDSHAGFVMPLAADDAAQLQAVPRKQRAELRKGLAQPLEIRTGNGAQDRAWHYRVYSESVRNLGTPVFPRRLFARVLDAFGQDADILTVLHAGQPVASVLSLYHGGAVMPYWGGGVLAARALRANDVMYYALMNHARGRGMDRFDFGRSKVDSGAYHFKRNWGFVPQPLSYAHWTADGQAPRDVNPLSPRYQAKIRLWQKLPLPLANLIGPIIARGLA